MYDPSEKTRSRHDRNLTDAFYQEQVRLARSARNAAWVAAFIAIVAVIVAIVAVTID